MNILINGCNGKMGQEIAKQVKITEGVDILCGVDRTDSGDNSFPVFTKAQDVDLIPDVIIDFSAPVSTFNILEFAERNKVPIVIATTGFTEDEMEKIKSISKLIPIFKSANMSYEINLMNKIVSEIATKLRDADIEIIETHHNRKVDSPSGTALLLADGINKALDNQKEFVYDRHSRRDARKKQEIGISSIRGGTEVGSHSVIFFGDNESFEIKHSCTSRSVFANGAIKAAKFLEYKEVGLYSMNDLL